MPTPISQTFASRKFILAILVLISLSVAFFIGKIPAETYMYGLSFAVAIYSGANLIEKFKK